MVYVPELATAGGERRGVVLLVVMALLALFAAVGLSFVFYADAEATAAEWFRAAANIESNQPPDYSAEAIGAFFLSQLIYDADDTYGVYSGFRGHSLARNMYGYNAAGLNCTPYNGIGRAHYTVSLPAPYGSLDDYGLVNYTYYPTDKFIRDPERMKFRNDNTVAQTNPFVASSVSYTYPDQNNMFLAAVNANGEVLMQSYRRPWLPVGRYTTLQPDQTWHDPAFKTSLSKDWDPLDSTGMFGDVKNLELSPGTVYYSSGVKSHYKNDSFWIDPGFPTITAANGQKFRVLVAPLIMDLDGKLNLSVHGNIRGGTANTHVSNHGLGAFEVNLARGLTGADTTQLFLGATVGKTTYKGRYGPDGAPAKKLSQIPALPTGYQQISRFYSFLDFDGIINPNYPTNSYDPTASYTPTARALLPGEAGNANPGYYGFRNIDPAGYSNADDFERTNHPALFNPLNPNYTSSAGVSDDRIFGWTDQEALLRLGLKGSIGTKSDLMQLLPKNFNDTTDATTIAASARRRWLCNIGNFDLGLPSASGWLNPADAAYVPYTMGTAYPTGAASPFPASFPASGAGEFGADWRGVNVALGRLDINRALTNYPTADATGQIPAASLATFKLAQADRQQFARDIFDRLRWVTTGQGPATTLPDKTTDTAKWNALMWLAQLAVNIVDYRDNDDFVTPFNWVPSTDPQYNKADASQWVYGTELPKVVINEAFAQVGNDPTDPNTTKATVPYKVNFWVELLNPMKNDGQSTVQLWMPANGNDGSGSNAAYAIYKLAVAGIPSSAAPWTADKLFTDTNQGATFLPGTTPVAYPTLPAAGEVILEVSDFTPTPAAAVAAPYSYQTYSAPAATVANFIQPADMNYSGPSAQNQGFYVLGPIYDFPSTTPKTPPLNLQQATLRVNDNKNGGNNTLTPDNNAGIRNSLTYEIPQGTLPTAFPKHNLFLRRLACPLLPPQTDPTDAGNKGYYNPYITVDSMQNLPSYDGLAFDTAGAHTPTTALTAQSAVGRRQPYSAHSTQQVNQTPDTDSATAGIQPYTDRPQHTFFRHNAVESASPPDPALTGQTLYFADSSPKNYGAFDWLVHLDRYLTSPVELLQVSGFRPHELTQQFITGNATSLSQKFTHRAPWFDPTARLYRLFEFLSVSNLTAGVSNGGRIPGKININTIYGPYVAGTDAGDEEIFQALADAQGVSSFTTAQVKTMFENMLIARTGGGGVPGVPGSNGASDRPFKSLASGNIAAAVNTQYPLGSGIGDTLFRVVTPITDPSTDPNQNATTSRLFEIAPSSGTDNPYVKMELMSKIFNNVTTRSNVFAVWLTIGFFEVVDPDAKPPKLGAEINRATSKHIRHRIFAIVDRSQLRLFPTATDPVTATVVSATSTPPVYTVQCNPGTTNLKGANGTKWNIQPGMLLEVDVGGNAQTVMVLTVTGNTFTARFDRPPVLDQPVPFICRGNPGPVSSTNPAVPAGVNPKYDPRQDPVVTYFSVID